MTIRVDGVPPLTRLKRYAEELLKKRPELADIPDEEDGSLLSLARLYANEQGIEWRHVASAVGAVLEAHDAKVAARQKKKSEAPPEEQEPKTRLKFKNRANKKTNGADDDDNFYKQVAQAIEEQPPLKQTTTKPIRIDHTPKPRKRQKVAVISNEVESIAANPKIELSPCSINARRTIYELVFRVNAKRDNLFWPFKLTSYEFSRDWLGLDYDLNHNQIEKLLKEVLSTHAVLRQRTQTHKIFRGISVVADAKLATNIVTGKGAITLELSSKLKPYLLNLPKNYRKLLPSVFELGTPRAMQLYEYLRQLVGLRNPSRIVPMKDLQRIMLSDAPWKEFRRSILDPAVADINKTTELLVRYDEIRAEGRHRKRGTVESVKFTVRKRLKPKLLSFKGDKS